MFTESERIYFEDILECIAAVESYLKGLTLEAYLQDRRTRRAVEREFQILTEAAFRLGDRAALLCPAVDWRGVRGLGNFLRHEYEKVEDVAIWETIHGKLPELRRAVEETLERLGSAS